MKTIERVVSYVKNHTKLILIIGDFFAVVFSAAFATVLKFDGSVYFPGWLKENILIIVTVYAITMLLSFLVFKIYNRMWQYLIIKDYVRLSASFASAFGVATLPFIYIWSSYTREYATWLMLFLLFTYFLVLVERGFVSVLYKVWRTKVVAIENSFEGKRKRVMIIGAGGAALRLLEELRGHNYVNRYKVVALIDDNKRKHGEYLGGIKVYGGRETIIDTVNELDVDEIFVAIPSTSEQNKKEILEICNKTGCELKMLPRITAIEDGPSIKSQLRKVDYTDLLGREQIKPDLSKVFELLKGHTVLVTGGGGSIGGELVRQVAASGVAKRIIIFDIAENGAYDIQQEIRRKYPDVDLKVLIGSVRDEKRLCEVFEEYKPSFVYHAAAHKHVPLMEDSPKEAVKNNVFGTYNLAKTADKYGVKRFVMISTDKAVNPTNVMGATKRVCEKIVQSFNKISETDFVAVRFGTFSVQTEALFHCSKSRLKMGVLLRLLTLILSATLCLFLKRFLSCFRQVLMQMAERYLFLIWVHLLKSVSLQRTLSDFPDIFPEKILKLNIQVFEMEKSFMKNFL